ncbi:MAG: hypothetical protein U9N59_04015 [Campylobacterota bacterium]|nr:hypothetical protein [Campylobacterota bacterium]
MFKIFVDSIVVRIDYQKQEDKVLKFNRFVSFVESLPEITLHKKEKIPPKFYNMHLSKNMFGNQLIECFSFSDIITLNHQKIYIYSTHHGIYTALHGLVQYDDDHRVKKLNLLHNLYNRYNLNFTKIDIAIDINEKIEDIKIYDKQNISLKQNSKSNEKVIFYQESNQDRSKQQRVLKLYEKYKQKHRSFPYPNVLSRIEMTLRSSKLKRFDKEYLSTRISKELTSYKIFIKNKEIEVSSAKIDLLLNDLFNILFYGKNNKTYASHYRNINTSVSKMKLAWLCFENDTPKKIFIKSNDIGLTVLKKYCKLYREQV